jgi:hypothetical protein
MYRRRGGSSGSTITSGRGGVEVVVDSTVMLTEE